MVMKQQLARASRHGGVAGSWPLALLALLKPAGAAGVKFTTDDLNSEASSWRSSADSTHPGDSAPSRAGVIGQAPGLNAFADLSSLVAGSGALQGQAAEA